MFFTTLLKEKIGYILFFLALAYFLLLIRSDIVQNSKLGDERSLLVKEIELEEGKQADLKNKLNALKKDSYIEQMAREKLGLVKKGESAYKVIIK